MKKTPAFSLGLVCIFNCICSLLPVKHHLFSFFSEQVVNMASIHVMFNARRALAFFTRSQSVSCSPCKGGREPLESVGSGCHRAELGPESSGRTSSSLEGIISVSKL